MNWFAGASFNVWWKFLLENKSILSPNNWLKIFITTLLTLRNSRLAKKEQILLSEYNFQVNKIKDPIFILGHWRSGTTHLHNLIINDTQFNYPTLFQVTYPNTYLTILKKLNTSGKENKTTRPMDNVIISARSPGEEEVAVWTMCNASSIGNRLLKSKETHYDRFLTFENASQHDLEKWKTNFIYFLNKISFDDNRQLVLKSPESTARIKLLLEIFPDAKFINIHRNPYEVFQSTLNLYQKVIKPSYYHSVSNKHLIDRIISTYNTMHASLFENMTFIPNGNLVNLSYEELISEPIQTIENIYTTLRMNLSSTSKESMIGYLDSINDYKKNKYDLLDKNIISRINEEWSESFSKWNYDIQ